MLNSYLTNCANVGQAPTPDVVALLEAAEAMQLACTGLQGAAQVLGNVTDRQIRAMQQHQQVICDAVERLTYRGVAPALLAPRPEPSQPPPVRTVCQHIRRAGWIDSAGNGGSSCCDCGEVFDSAPLAKP